MKRTLTFLLALALLFCQAAAALAVSAEEQQTVLDLAAAAEAGTEKSLRSVVVHVYSSDEAAVPKESDAPETVFLKTVSLAMEKGWAFSAAGEETPGVDRLLELARLSAEAELEALSSFRDVSFGDPLLDFFRRAMLANLDDQLLAVSSEEADRVAVLWRWNDLRQDSVKLLFFLNRYYGVSVLSDRKSDMNSWLYEGALLVTESTVEELVQAEAAREQAAEADGAGSGADEAPAAIDYGSDIWHTDPEGAYELRIHDFDRETLTVLVDLREKETGREVPCGAVDLSGWEKYQKDRRVLDTFYKVTSLENADGRLSFQLYMNVLFDGRLYRELKGKISLKLPSQKAAESSAGSQDAGASVGEAAEEDPAFPEDPISQDFTSLGVGDTFLMGYYEQDGNTENLREPIQWKIISIHKKKNVALVLATYGLEPVSFGKAGDEEARTQIGLNWKNSWLREWLNGDFYDKTFTKSEKARIRTVSNVTDDPSGRFTTKDQVFLLSNIEVKRYLKKAEAAACEATEYAKAKLSPEGLTKDGYCLWYVRELTKAAKNDRRGNYVKNSTNEAGYVYGSAGLRYYLRKKGLPIDQADTVLVRPAMWIKLGAMN